MKGRDEEDDEFIDLQAMLGEAKPSAEAPVVNPLTTLSSDVYLLTVRDAAAEPLPSQRDSFAAVSSQTLPPPALKRSHLPAVLGFAVGATLVGGLAAWLSMRAPATATTAVRSHEAMPIALPVTPANTSAAKAAPARLAKPERRARPRATSVKRASWTAPKSSPAPVAAAPPTPNEAAPAQAEPATEAAEPALAVEEPSTSIALAQAEEEAAPPAITPSEEQHEAPVEAKRRTPMTGPSRPSLGSIAAALRAVLPAARSCLQPGATMATGQVTFASDGTVTNVQLTGSAASDECIRSALSNAKVPAFNENAFKTPFVVRP